MTPSDAFFRVGQQQLCSNSLYLFLKDFSRSTDLFYFTLSLASNADRSRTLAAKALIGEQENPITTLSEPERLKLKTVLAEPNTVMNKLTEFGVLNSRNITNTFVESFLWFLSSIMQAALKKRPEALKSKEKIEIEEVLGFRTRNELIFHLIDKKVSSLSYGGISGIEKYISDTLNITLFDNEVVRNACILLIEVRNVNAHNRGIINKTFIQRTQGSAGVGFQVGKSAHLDFDSLLFLTSQVIEISTKLDQKVCEKFRIQRKRFAAWEQ